MPNELLAFIPKAEGIRTHESLGIMLRCMSWWQPESSNMATSTPDNPHVNVTNVVPPVAEYGHCLQVPLPA